MTSFRVVICGGGIAAVEGLLRVRKLLGDKASVEVVAPNDELVYRPMAVKEPFAAGPPASYPLARITDDCRAEWRKDSLGWVDPDAQAVHTGAGESVPYDAC